LVVAAGISACRVGGRSLTLSPNAARLEFRGSLCSEHPAWQDGVDYLTHPAEAGVA